MVKITQQQTYKIVNYILQKKQFTQYEIAKSTKVSKGMASYVINWLLEKEYVEKKPNKYLLVSPSALYSLFRIYRNMKKNLVGSFSVSADRNALLKELIKRKVVFCATTALQEHSLYFQDPSINFYSDDKKLLQQLAGEKTGLTKINFFKPDMCLEIDIEKKGNKMYTNKIRTIIDLFCNDQAYTAKELMEKVYGERLG